MKSISLALALFSAAIAHSAPVFAESYTTFLEDGSVDFDQRVQENEQWRKEKKKRDADTAKRRAAERDKSNDFCFSIKNQDAQNACLGEPYRVTNRRAQNILLGNCDAFGTDSDFNRHLQYICVEGKTGCSLLDDSTAAYQCYQCGGTRRWLATFSLGTTIYCRK